jgi:hypothetical protein
VAIAHLTTERVSIPHRALICERMKYSFRHDMALPGGGHAYASVSGRHRGLGPFTGGSCSFDSTSAASARARTGSWARFLAF